MRKTGCQPPWRSVSVEGLPLCDNRTMLLKYGDNYIYAVNYGKNALLERTKCMMPCSFMEYKVICNVFLLNNNNIFYRSHRTQKYTNILQRRKDQSYGQCSLVKKSLSEKRWKLSHWCLWWLIVEAFLDSSWDLIFLWFGNGLRIFCSL